MKYSLESKYIIKQELIPTKITKKQSTIKKKFEYSSYYLYDEQFLRLNRTRHYRLTLFDAILNIPVSERIICRRIPKNTKKFILDSTENKPFICITTDLFPMYRNVADENRSKTSIVHISFVLNNES